MAMHMGVSGDVEVRCTSSEIVLVPWPLDECVVLVAIAEELDPDERDLVFMLCVLGLLVHVGELILILVLWVDGVLASVSD